MELNTTETISEIQKLVKKGKYEEALKICAKDEYKDNTVIQAERIFIFNKKLNDYDTAYMLWKEVKDSNDVNIIVNGIDLLMKRGELKEALEYANNHVSEDIKYIHRRLKLLVALERKDEVIELANDPRYKTDDVVRKIKEAYLGKSMKNSKACDEITILLTRIYVGNITVEDIKNSDIDTYKQSLLLLAYYEKNNRNGAIGLLKKIKKTISQKEYKEKYSIIEERLLSKKSKHFDIDFYMKLLDRFIDFDLASKYEKEIKEKEEEKALVDYISSNKDKKEEKVENEIKKPVKSKVKDLTIYTSVVGTRINRYSNITNNTNINNKQIIGGLIKDEYANMVDYIGKYLYVRMQSMNNDVRSHAIKYWDSLEILANNPSTDLDSYNKIANAYQKIKNKELDNGEMKLIK